MAAARRLGAVAAATGAGAPASALSHDEDVVIVSALRTAVCKARRGGFKDTTPDVLLASVISATLERTGFPADKLGDICVGEFGGALHQPCAPRLYVYLRRQCLAARWGCHHGTNCTI